MTQKVRVILYGCGVIGGKVAKAILQRTSFELVGAIDINPNIVGKDLGEVVDAGRRIGVTVDKDPAEVIAHAEADAVVLTTTSRLKTVAEQMVPCVEAGLDVVSTCEELSYPWKRHPELAREIDERARRHNATVVGTGINPGYLMDALPLFLTAPCLRVDAVRVVRMMNSARRRIPFQQKVGTGLTPAEFHKKISDGSITGHVGLTESAYMIADGLGWQLDQVEEKPPQPVIAERDVDTGLGRVPRGNVIGLKSLAFGRKSGRDLITLEFVAYAGVAEEYDEVEITGEPNIRYRAIGGVHGDAGTVGVTVNTIPRAVAAAPGLRTMKDLAVPSFVP